MRIIGVDPGTRVTGWGIIESEGTRLRRVCSGTIAPKSEDLAHRLRAIADGLDAVVAEYSPEVSAVESLFHAKNSQSALKLGHARGAILVSLARADVGVFEYAPSRIKQAVTNHGRASKEQVQEMVKLLLGYGEPMVLDESDALAAAICHVQYRGSPTSQLMEDLYRKANGR